ncbi:unnamed protein product [Staurois parvus]|uniref:Uncharacterized protein n=1 Tax=Staurois parvus TaxID=386267 RepID=A0ABN9EA76_9NEOB|nr:unnamed protein product [Staurois parvus]
MTLHFTSTHGLTRAVSLYATPCKTINGALKRGRTICPSKGMRTLM